VRVLLDEQLPRQLVPHLVGHDGAAIPLPDWPAERQRDVKQIYNPMNREQLAALAPEFDWPTLLERSPLGKVDTIVAAETTAIAELGKMLASVPLETWKDYSAYHFVRNHAQFISRERSIRRVSSSTARHSAACRNSANEPSAESTWSTTRSARRSAGSTSRGITRPRAAGRCRS
jgi:hypothetical protein